MEYEIIDYGSMIADRIRIDAYVQALERTVKPGDIVLDIGTGTGIMALVACRLGAKRVIAVERDDVIDVARQIAHANGVGDQIEFVQGRSTDIEIAEQADVIVSDLRGVLPLHSTHIPAVIDARDRLLAPGGTMIPKRDTVWAALVDAPVPYRRRVETWSRDGLGFDLSGARELATNAWWRERIEEDQVLSEKWLVTTLDYETIADTSVTSAGAVVARRAGTAHGLCMWFDAELTDGQGFSNAPDMPQMIYGGAFFPLEQPVEIEEGDAIHLRVRAVPAGARFVWAWSTSVERAGEMIVSFRQSTALGVPLTKTMLERSSAQFVPSLAADGQRLKFALELMAGDRSLEEIAELLAERYPDVPNSLAYVVRLAQQYSR